MAEIVLTNGEYYIAIGNNNALSKTQDINEATRFISNEVARYVKATHEKRCKGYHPMNLNPNKDRRKYSADVKRMVAVQSAEKEWIETSVTWIIGFPYQKVVLTQWRIWIAYMSSATTLKQI